MNSLRGRRLKRRGIGFRAREMPSSFPYWRLSPRLCNEIQFHYASMRAMSLFLAIFVKFKMLEGLNFFPRYPTQFRYLRTWSVRLQRSNAVRALFLASTHSFFKVLLQVVFRSARFSFSSLCPPPSPPPEGWGLGLSTPHGKIRCSYWNYGDNQNLGVGAESVANWSNFDEQLSVNHFGNFITWPLVHCPKRST